jgi:hypothetical protein
MITEQDLQEYNKWLMEVWNPNQLYIPFAIDAPKAFLKHRNKVKNVSPVILAAKEDVLKEAEKQILNWLQGSTEKEIKHYRVAFRRSYEYILKVSKKTILI